MDIQQITEQVEKQSVVVRQIMAEVEKIIVGQRGLLDRMLIGLLCDGHLLLEGLPGLAKTTAVKTLATAIHTSFQRIQFTPDLLPADILGTQIYRPDNGTFEIKKGPIFNNIILADEINRAPAKVQSALLEAMQERQVTIGQQTFMLENPFLVLATQNPIEQEGTYPLPEAQIDRFFFKLKINYPNQDELREILEKTTEDYHYELSRVLGAREILNMKSLVKKVPVASHVKDFATRLVLASHPDNEHASGRIREYVLFGASPRGLQSLILAGKVSALIEGRYNVSLDDIKQVAKPALRHRMALNIRGETEGLDTDELVDEIVNKLDGG